MSWDDITLQQHFDYVNEVCYNFPGLIDFSWITPRHVQNHILDPSEFIILPETQGVSQVEQAPGTVEYDLNWWLSGQPEAAHPVEMSNNSDSDDPFIPIEEPLVFPDLSNIVTLPEQPIDNVQELPEPTDAGLFMDQESLQRFIDEIQNMQGQSGQNYEAPVPEPMGLGPMMDQESFQRFIDEFEIPVNMVTPPLIDITSESGSSSTGPTEVSDTMASCFTRNVLFIPQQRGLPAASIEPFLNKKGRAQKKKSPSAFSSPRLVNGQRVQRNKKSCLCCSQDKKKCDGSFERGIGCSRCASLGFKCPQESEKK
ncbi:uncharacterized protein IL334_004170 [Kwoniella shivajii]|uniref:Zn(2)-C6 fungal-type domain-containing protein n=1 Tax=Kwoniella shivajii TaxID=564305 RepID=A0ABZ1D1G6_9TREE|nr:hypothetical protein IL334_004170 [Kwoniella shivajii]